MRVDRNKDSKLIDWDRRYEEEVNGRWPEAYLDKQGKPKPTNEREKRIRENKSPGQVALGAYPHE